MVLEGKLFGRVLLLGALGLGVLAVITRQAAAQTSSLKLLVVNSGTGDLTVQGNFSLAIVDPNNNKVVGRVPIGGHPHELAVSADGTLAFVSNTSFGQDPEQIPDDTISVIDLAARKELRRFEVGPGSGPHGLVFAGGKVYFTAQGFKLVGRYDPAINKIDWMLGTGLDHLHLVMTKDMKKIFTGSADSGTVAVIEPWNPAADSRKSGVPPTAAGNLTLISVGKGPEGIAISPDQKEVWTLNKGDGSISIIDVATKRVSETLDLKAKDLQRVTFTPDGKRAVIVLGERHDKGDLLVFDTVTRREIKRITNIGPRPHGLLIAPDGSRAYVGVKGSNYVAIIDLKTLELTGRISTGDGPDGMSWAETR